jgi:hypothetical protein
MSIIPALGRWRQEECEFKASLDKVNETLKNKIKTEGLVVYLKWLSPCLVSIMSWVQSLVLYTSPLLKQKKTN